jgi:hypothetical protein
LTWLLVTFKFAFASRSFPHLPATVRIVSIQAEIPILAGIGNLGGFAMFSHVHFAAVAAWLFLAVAGLLWVMACGPIATKMEKEGIPFWKGFLANLLLSPMMGVIAIFISRMLRPGRPLAPTVSRG